jgi:hypothetical protein
VRLTATTIKRKKENIMTTNEKLKEESEIEANKRK